MYFFQSVKALSEKAPQGLRVRGGKRGDSRLTSTAAAKTCRLSFKVLSLDQAQGCEDQGERILSSGLTWATCRDLVC